LNLIRVMPAKGRTTMAHSKQIAGLVGPMLAAIGIAMLINRGLIPPMIEEAAHNYALIFLSGLLTLLAGLAIVRAHNVWTGGWPVLVTVIGWLAIVSGLVRMWLPQVAAPVAEAFSGSAATIVIGGLVLLILGAFLSDKAYGPDT
jgi:hypothetical protein